MSSHVKGEARPRGATPLGFNIEFVVRKRYSIGLVPLQNSENPIKKNRHHSTYTASGTTKQYQKSRKIPKAADRPRPTIESREEISLMSKY